MILSFLNGRCVLYVRICATTGCLQQFAQQQSHAAQHVHGLLCSAICCVAQSVTCAQISNIRIIKEAMREASFLYAELVALGAAMGTLDVGGGC